MNIPFIDLNAQYQRIEDDVNQSIRKVLDHGSYIMGPEVRELESQLSQFCGSKHTISCSNGTDAIVMALMALEIGPGDSVFTPSFTFFATAEAISTVGATPIFVDIDAETYNLDAECLENAIESAQKNSGLNAKAVIAVDLFGLPADYSAIRKVCDNHGLALIEDAAQGFGGKYFDKVAGALGDISTTSFFPAKPLGCYGDGGAVFTDNDDLADRLRSIRVHGKGSDKYDNVRMGLNARLDTLQAAILISKLSIFADEIDRRQNVANLYTEKLQGVVKTPYIPQSYESVWAQYTVQSDKREAIIETLKSEGIPTAIYYPTPCHLSTAYADLGYQSGDLPVTEMASQSVFSLPMHPYLESDLIEKICGIISNAAA